MATDRFDREKKANQATTPYNTYDSLLEIPSGNDPNQNAWLTLKLRVALNFVDSTHPPVVDPTTSRPPLLSQKADGKWYANDADGWQFPILDWPPFFKDKFKDQFQKHAEKVWNWQFVLVTPTNFSGLDITDPTGNWLIRPNILCLFRLEVALANVHRTINIVNLDLRATSVTNTDPTKPAKTISAGMDAGTWRSDAGDYDDRDLFKPYMWNSAKNIWHDTIGHEIGHALGQDHILPLKGSTTCATPKEGNNAPPCYGITFEDQANIMGKGDKIYLVNAVSWRERIALHTFRGSSNTVPADWGVTGQMNTPPRRMSLAASAISTNF